MSCLGVHFALTETEVIKLQSFSDEEERLNYLKEVIEEQYFELHAELKAESDKSWDALHRALTDGELDWDGGEYPLNHVVFGGESLYSGDDYIMSLKSPAQVHDIAAALAHLREDEFRSRYFKINPRSYGQPVSEDDFGYTWGCFEGIRDLFTRAAAENRYVLFTADQ